jgi:hypothetical protein
MSDEKVEIPDVFGDALVNVMNYVHKEQELVTGFVVLLETYDGKKKKMRTVVSPGMPEYQIFGMINFANETFAYADIPDDDEDFDSDDYDPDWYKRQ